MEMVRILEIRLPDIVMPFNVMDESLLIVPFETIREYVRLKLAKVQGKYITRA